MTTATTFRTVIACMVLMGGVIFALRLAQPAGYASAAGELPPRPTAAVGGPTPHEAVGMIELRVPGAPPELRSAVQWEGPPGTWHDVEGWQQMLGASGIVRWSVYPRDYGSGPFRWILRDASGREMLAASDAFRLPARSGELLVVAPKAQ